MNNDINATGVSRQPYAHANRTGPGGSTSEKQKISGHTVKKQRPKLSERLAAHRERPEAKAKTAEKEWTGRGETSNAQTEERSGSPVCCK